MEMKILVKACSNLAMSDGIVEYSQSGFVDFTALILCDRFLNETRASILDSINPVQEHPDFSKYLNELDEVGPHYFCKNHVGSGLLSKLVGSSTFLRQANRQLLEEESTSDSVELEDEIEWLEEKNKTMSLAACDLSPVGKDHLSRFYERSSMYAKKKGYRGSYFSEDDVAQETTAKVVREYPRQSGPNENFEAYMERVSKYCEFSTTQVYKSKLRSKKSRPLISIFDEDGQVIFEPIDSESDPFDNVVFEEFVSILHGILNPKENDPQRVLTEDELYALKGKFIDGKTQQQIADELGVGQPAVSRIIREGLRKLLGFFCEKFGND